MRIIVLYLGLVREYKLKIVLYGSQKYLFAHIFARPELCVIRQKYLSGLEILFR